MTLFRKDAIDAVCQHEPNRVMIYGPPGFRTYLTTCVAFCVAAILLLTHLELHRSVPARGWLEPSKGLVTIQPQIAGYVSATHAVTGDRVKPGQALFDIDVEPHQAASRAKRYYALLEAERRKLKLRIEQTEAQLQQNEARYAARATALEQEIAASQAALALQDERTELAQATLTSLHAVFSKGAIARLDIDRAQAALLDERREREGLAREAERLTSERSSLPVDQATDRSVLTNRLTALQQELIGLDQRQMQFALGRTEQVVAPVAGRLTALGARPGDQIDSGRMLAAIVPEGSELQAHLYLPPRALGYVRRGQEVRLRVEPFPHQKFGTLGAVVARVGQVLEDTRHLPQELQPASHAFKVTATIAPHQLAAGDQEFQLHPQMRIEADVRLEARRAWEWLLEPLLSAWRQA